MIGSNVLIILMYISLIIVEEEKYHKNELNFERKKIYLKQSFLQ